MSASSIALLQLTKESNGSWYTYWCARAWAACGCRIVHQLPLPRLLRVAIGRARLCFSVGLRRKRLVVPASGRLDSVAWPWCYFYEIIPMIWDCWPFQQVHLENFIRRNRCRLCFCTSSQTAQLVGRHCPGTRAVWIPEGIDVDVYPKGDALSAREIDVLEYGRVLVEVHAAFKQLRDEGRISYYYPCESGKRLETIDDLTRTIRKSKISICFPQCDTNPQRAGDIETLTQRYWEAMLSGTLILGRAPRELIDFCGYNPVIDLDRSSDSARRKVLEVLAHIEDYQELADRNEKFARENAPWSKRVPMMLRALQELDQKGGVR